MATDRPAAASPLAALPILRNTILLSACMAALYGMVQMFSAIATITFVKVSGVKSLVGIPTTIIFGTNAIAALFAGRAMDRYGRVPVLAVGFVVGACGCVVTGLATHYVSTPAMLAGFMLIGSGQGATFLSRIAGADMFPPAKRGKGIAYVLMGAVVSAVLGPFIFMPLFANKSNSLDALVTPWFVAAGFMLLGLLLVLFVRPDPRRIAEILASASQGANAGPPAPATPLRELVRRPRVLAALIAAFSSFGVMVAVMTLTGYVMLGHGHHQETVFPVLSAHFMGMFALVLVVGHAVDKFGRATALITGLLMIGASTVALIWFRSASMIGLSLFGIGLGWNLSFVSATAEMTSLTTPNERGSLLGLSDLLSSMFAAVLSLLGGVVLGGEVGLVTLCVMCAAFSFIPVVFIASIGRRSKAA